MTSRAWLAAVAILLATAASAQTTSPYEPKTDASASEIFERTHVQRPRPERVPPPGGALAEVAAYGAPLTSPYEPKTDASASEIFERWQILRPKLEADATDLEKSDTLADVGDRLPSLTSRTDSALLDASELSTEAAPVPDHLAAVLQKLEDAEKEILTLVAEIFERTRVEKPRPESVLPAGESLAELDASVASVAWLGRDPQTTDAWRSIVDLYFGTDEERRRAIMLATDLENARRQLALVPFVARGEQVEQQRMDARAAYAGALASIRKEARGGNVAAPVPTVGESATPIPQRGGERAVIVHLREARELLQSSHIALRKLGDTGSRN